LCADPEPDRTVGLDMKRPSQRFPPLGIAQIGPATVVVDARRNDGESIRVETPMLPVGRDQRIRQRNDVGRRGGPKGLALELQPRAVTRQPPIPPDAW